MADYPIVWYQPSTQTRITVNAEYKHREWPNAAANGLDEWPTLWRSDVPALTDEEWSAAPGPDWVRV